MQRMDLELQGSAPLSVQGEERVQGIGGHTAPEFRIQQDTKHFQRFLRSMNVPIRSAPQPCYFRHHNYALPGGVQGICVKKIIRGANIITPQGNQGPWCSGCLCKRIQNKLPWQERGGYQMSAAAFLPVFPVNRLLMTFFFFPAETIRCQPCKTLLRWASCHSETAQQLLLIKAIVVVSRRRIMGQFIGHYVVLFASRISNNASPPV